MMHANARRHRLTGTERGGIFFRLLFLIFLAVLAFVIYLARYPILRFAGNFWVADESPQVSDVIVVLSDDDFDAVRASRAADLFRAEWAPRIVASGRALRPYASIAELMQHDLTDRGVPAAAVVRFPNRARNTLEEAGAVSEFLSSRGWKKIIVVTSNYHTRRARFIYERMLAPGTELRVIAAPDPAYDPNSWWRTREGLKTFFYELVGYIVARWELRNSDVRTVSSLLLPALLPRVELRKGETVSIYS
ncbi:MAG TPA: YdcF family protein [Candidatus Acidoferrum sp.]|nr:YdcF family protein [Candidatus Acidoferrum sp.]